LKNRDRKEEGERTKKMLLEQGKHPSAIFMTNQERFFFRAQGEEKGKKFGVDEKSEKFFGPGWLGG
jgi:hypothetical protein